jgi:hypothetical protein
MTDKEKPKHNQIWKTVNGHRVRILLSMLPGPARCIETAYVDGPVNGRNGINFEIDTWKAVLGDDQLLEREQ